MGMSKPETQIDVAISEGVQTIRIQRPEKKNALLGEMYTAMRQALIDGDASDAVRAHILTGSGGVFSAGNDIKDFLNRSSGDGGASFGESPALQFIGALPRVKKPLIAAVDGLAVGVGVTLLFHCDLVYASPTATFTTPFLNLGLVPEAGSSLLAPRRMGHARAFEMLVLGETFSAERAREAGLVNAVVPAEDLDMRARKAALQLASKPPEALRIARDLLRGEPDDVSERSDLEAQLFSVRMQTPEAREAFQAFLEKRPAKFNAP